jgi:beta-1,4-mannosyltransferase
MVSDRRVRVLMSFGPPRATTNPYVKQLVAALEGEPEIDLRFFVRWRAILGPRYDVFHVHWPEILLEQRTGPRRAYRRITTLLLCLRLFLGRVAVVRTWHNVERPSGIGRIDHLVLDVLDRLTVVRIRLNDSGAMPGDAPYVTMPHGHYRSSYAPFARSEAVAGRLLFVGLVRRYKGVERLLEAFGTVADPDLSLRVAGLPSTPELTETVESLAAADARVSTRLEFLDDDDYVREVTASELVVLPYPQMHNSGSVLAALSLERPVLVPDNEVNRRLVREVGPGWVHLYAGELDPDDIAAAFAALHEAPPSGVPNLSARDWDAVGQELLEVYRDALSARRGA